MLEKKLQEAHHSNLSHKNRMIMRAVFHCDPSRNGTSLATPTVLVFNLCMVPSHEAKDLHSRISIPQREETWPFRACIV